MNDRMYLSFYPNRVAQQYDYAQHARDWRHDVQQRRAGGGLDYVSPVKYWFKDKEHVSYPNKADLSLEKRMAQEQRETDFHQWMEWQDAGRNIFAFSEGLLEMLGHTEVGDISILDINAPFQVIYLDLSAAGISFVEGSSAKVEGVYVTQTDPRETEGEDFKVTKCLSFHFAGDYVGAFPDIHSELMELESLNWYFLDSHHAMTGAERTVGQALDRSLAFAGEPTPEKEARQAEITALYGSFIERTIHLTVNCLLYLMLPEKEVVQQELRPDLPESLQKRLRKADTKAKQKLVQAEIKNLGFTRVNYVGSSIARRAERADSGSGGVAPHWRRGHWRNQRLGAGLAKQRLTWIKPVVVNKQLGSPGKGRIYDVS